MNLDQDGLRHLHMGSKLFLTRCVDASNQACFLDKDSLYYSFFFLFSRRRKLSLVVRKLVDFLESVKLEIAEFET